MGSSSMETRTALFFGLCSLAGLAACSDDSNSADPPPPPVVTVGADTQSGARVFVDALVVPNPNAPVTPGGVTPPWTKAPILPGVRVYADRAAPCWRCPPSSGCGTTASSS